MPIGKCLQEILCATAGVSQAEAGQDSFRAQPRDEVSE